jgi:hypothetical protein
VLTGAAFGVAIAFVALARATILPRFGFPPELPTYGRAVNVVTRGGRLITGIIGGGVGALEGALLAVLVFVVLRLLLRRPSLTIAAGVLLMTLASAGGLGNTGTQWAWLFPLTRGVLLTFVVVRRGLLATIATLYFANAVTNLPLRLDFSHWAGTPSLWALALFIAMACFAFYPSRAGQPLFGKLLSEN